MPDSGNLVDRTANLLMSNSVPYPSEPPLSLHACSVFVLTVGISIKLVELQLRPSIPVACMNSNGSFMALNKMTEVMGDGSGS